MLITAKLNYVCRALIEIAQNNGDNGYVRINDIARNQKIPKKYLIHILLGLKKGKIIGSVRGKQGGYYLIRKPESITLKEIFQNSEGGLLFKSSIMDDTSVHSQVSLNTIWQEFESVINRYTEGVTLQHVLDMINKNNRNYVYNI
ncbi:MAG: Rrf2 family transcriptional regulator [Elusimicrobia bacterium]|nr:Rrf2 family transcriptional regulator [Elusimicrobiota bacterium]